MRKSCVFRLLHSRFCEHSYYSLFECVLYGFDVVFNSANNLEICVKAVVIF